MLSTYVQQVYNGKTRAYAQNLIVTIYDWYSVYTEYSKDELL